MHCVVIDDSELVRKVFGRMFQRLGFRVNEAGNGKVALDACSADMPDVVLVDLNMPVMDGVTFIRYLRNLPSGDKPKVILCSIEDSAAHISEAMTAGADEYLGKPFDLQLLISKLSALGLNVAAS